jgi:2-(1,2-epoxy-1,2-dihydrophenyl)acetyl-CoA isomerase
VGEQAGGEVGVEGAGAEKLVHCERHGAVALIAIDRPERRNALNVPLIRKLLELVKEANADPDIGAIVLTAQGSTYSAGADIKAPPEPKDERGRRPNPGSLTMGKDDNNWPMLMQRSKPVIVAVNGPAIGMGVTHILSADIRIAAESATFAFPFLRLGAMPEVGATGLLPRLVGFGRALDLCLRSATIDAREAERIGLVTGVYPDAELRAAAVALAAQIASYPALQVKLTKGMFYDNASESSTQMITNRESLAFVEMLTATKREKPL